MQRIAPWQHNTPHRSAVRPHLHRSHACPAGGAAGLGADVCRWSGSHLHDAGCYALQALLDTLAVYCHHVGVAVNVGKTEEAVFGYKHSDGVGSSTNEPQGG